MEYRNNGEIPTLETRAEAEASVDKQKRYKQIIECLRETTMEGLTAKEVAVMMRLKGYIPTSERNYVSPRLTELSKTGLVEPIGKKKCEYTGRTVAVYSLTEGQYGVNA